MSDNEREKLKQRRRALIKAAGAAPVVFSLANGSAVAAASATCDTKPMGPTPGNVVTSSDNWVRETVTKYDITLKNNGGTISAFKQGNSYYSISGSEIKQSTYTGNPQSNGYLYLLKDYTGSSFQVYRAGSTVTNPITTSCWTSLNPTGVGSRNIL